MHGSRRPTLRCMEDRGELLGARFADGFSGEQFAHPEALHLLKQHQNSVDKSPIHLSSYNPLNLAGILLPGKTFRVGSVNRFIIEAGIPIEIETEVPQLNLSA